MGKARCLGCTISRAALRAGLAVDAFRMRARRQQRRSASDPIGGLPGLDVHH